MKQIFTTMIFALFISVLVLLCNPLKVSAANTNKELVFIGDSRFVGMVNTVKDIPYDSNGEIIASKDNEHYICKSGTQFADYNKTIKKELKKYKKEDVIIIYELGVNAIAFAQNDIDYLLSLQEDGWDVYYCDILPVDDSILQTYSASLREYQILEANKWIEDSGLKVIHYHDTCLVNLPNNTSDGLHFDSQTYKDWYNTILDNVYETECFDSNKLITKLNIVVNRYNLMQTTTT